jgi:hypothetical protein
MGAMVGKLGRKAWGKERIKQPFQTKLLGN